MAKMRKFALLSLLIFVLSGLAYSRSVRDDMNLISDGLDSEINDMNLISDGLDSEINKPPSLLLSVAAAETTAACEQTYGFLPCSTNIWGLVFLILVYEILLSIGETYVGKGSALFFQIIGPSVFGASLFQLLGTIPQVVLVLVSALSGTTAAAENRATLGMGLVAGSTVMLLTLIWGSSVANGSYGFHDSNTKRDPVNNRKFPEKGYGVVTDVETSYTAQIMLISLIPFVFLLIAQIFSSSTAKRVVYLLALILTVLLLLAYLLYQMFQPWIQTRRFELLMSKYAKDKLLKLLSRNGNPDLEKIQGLFEKLDKNRNAHVSADELRVLLLGVKMDDDDLDTDRDVENIMASFDISGDGLINKNEFIKGMTQLVSDLCDETPDRIKKSTTSDNSMQKNALVRTASKKTRPKDSTSWLNYLKASFFLIFGTFVVCALSEPLISSVISFAQAANLSSFWVSYLVIPLALNYSVGVQSISSAGQKSKKTISLTLSGLYGAVYMNNIIGLIVFLVPVYIRKLSSAVPAEITVVLVICITMSIVTSFRTIFYRWTSYIVLLLYPISLALVYVFTSVFGWS